MKKILAIILSTVVLANLTLGVTFAQEPATSVINEVNQEINNDVPKTENDTQKSKKLNPKEKKIDLLKQELQKFEKMSDKDYKWYQFWRKFKIGSIFIVITGSIAWLSQKIIDHIKFIKTECEKISRESYEDGYKRGYEKGKLDEFYRTHKINFNFDFNFDDFFRNFSNEGRRSHSTSNDEKPDFNSKLEEFKTFFNENFNPDNLNDTESIPINYSYLEKLNMKFNDMLDSTDNLSSTSKSKLKEIQKFFHKNFHPDLFKNKKNINASLLINLSRIIKNNLTKITSSNK